MFMIGCVGDTSEDGTLQCRRNSLDKINFQKKYYKPEEMDSI